MTQEEFLAILDASVQKNFAILQSELPYKTGNMAYNALKIKKTATGYEISIDPGIAPYSNYIDKPGYITAGYWDDSYEKFASSIARDLNGEIE